MFDNYHKHMYSGPSQIKVEEKRAPTDDSIRLFGEMRDKAVASVIASGHIPGRACLARWVVLDNPAWNGWTIKFVVEVNGVEHEGEFSASRADMMLSSSPHNFIDAVKDKMLIAIRGVVASAIYEQLLEESVGTIVSAYTRYNRGSMG